MATLLEESERLGIEWREPGPKPPRNAPKWTPILALLHERKGVWAMIGSYASRKTAAAVASRLRKTHPGFEFEVRVTAGRGELFGRAKGR